MISTNSKNKKFQRKLKGPLLVILAQILSSLANLTAKLLETQGEKLNPFQILQIRTAVMLLLSCLSVLWRPTPGYPFGEKNMRIMLSVRGVGGVLGASGFYYSLLYFDLAEATVLNFVAPILACLIHSLVVNRSVSVLDLSSGCISLIGVILVAQPAYLFASTQDRQQRVSTMAQSKVNMKGLGFAMIGAIGGAISYSSMRIIGERVHPLIAVNCYAVSCFLASTLAVVFLPGVAYVTAMNQYQWACLLFMGGCGSAMELLMMTGISRDESSCATNMTYTQVLFALIIDKIIWDKNPGQSAGLGTALIACGIFFTAALSRRYKVEDYSLVSDDEEMLPVIDQ